MASIASLACPSSAAGGNFDDRYVFVIDPLQTAIQYDIETNLGPCSIVGGDAGTMSGSLDLRLQAGVLPLESGCYDGGECLCLPNFTAVIPNVLPHLPPILEIDFLTLTLAPNSSPFLISNGGFNANTACDVVDGSLVVRLLGHLPCTVPLIGCTSDAMRTSGSISVDGGGIRLRREIGNTLIVDVPALGLNVQIRIRGQIRANLLFDDGTLFCTPTPNSTGLPASIGFTGSPSATLNDCVLTVSSCPPNVLGFFFYGPDEGSLPYGNGFRCVTGALHRLPRLHCSPNGTASTALDLDPQTSQWLRPGSTWGFQFVHRDGAAGGARLNASDALRLRFVP